VVHHPQRTPAHQASAAADSPPKGTTVSLAARPPRWRARPRSRCRTQAAAGRSWWQPGAFPRLPL